MISLATRKRREARYYKPKPKRQRTLAEILALPRTDQEEAFCDEYIAQQTALIRATWDRTEHEARRIGCRRDEVAPFVVPVVTWLGRE
jgi:hypothetical protein